MPPSLRRLLGQADLHLTLLTPEPALITDALDRQVQWVHASDLRDPTPFISEGQVLLTTGTQFDPDATDVAFYNDYVARLVTLGIAGLGFGTEVIRDGTPDPLVAACLSHGLPLFEVPYRTPFIAIARLAADLVAEESYARHTWAVRAQRAISLAALRPDGLRATLGELSKQLDHWVALFDAGGNLDRVFPTDALAGDALDTVRTEAIKLLRRGQRASSSVVSGGETLTLQTLGGSDKLRGVLALGGTAPLDHASQELVTSVIALAGLALEQNHAFDRARSHLRTGLLNALLGGSTELVSTIAAEMWGGLPVAPVRMAVTTAPHDLIDAVTEYLELRVEAHPGTVFYAVRGDRVVLCLAADSIDLVEDLCQAFDLHAGSSDPSSYAALSHALGQAEQGLQRALEGVPGLVEFDTISRQGVLAFLARTDAREVGRSTLAPLIAHDTTSGTNLLESVRVWLENNGQFDAAAQVLGIHRHTLRSRIQQAERLLTRDLATFHARADLWAAILSVDESQSRAVVDAR